MTVNDPGDLWLQDTVALRAELTSVKERQEILGDALELASDELEKLRAENERLKAELAECQRDYQ